MAVGEVSGPCCGLIYSINFIRSLNRSSNIYCSRHLTLDENGTAVSMDRRCASFRPLSVHTTLSGSLFFFSFLSFESRSRRDSQDDDSEEDEDEEGEEEDDDDEDEGEEGGPEEPDVTRAERRELKKKQAAEGAGKAQDEKQDGDGGGDEDEDALIANPNHVTKKLNISDLSAPRQLTRRERCVPHALLL